MLQRFANVIFYLLYACSILSLCGGLISFEWPVFALFSLASIGLFLTGWCIRYVLLGEKNFPGANYIILIGKKTHAYLQPRLKSFLASLWRIEWKKGISSTFQVIVVVLIMAVSASIAKGIVSDLRYNFNKPDFDKIIRSNPETKLFANSLSSYFPAEYKALISAVDNASKKGDKNEVKRVSYQFMQSFMRQQIPNIVSAPNSSIQKIIDEQFNLLSDFRKNDVQLCADFGVGQLSQNANLHGATLKKLIDLVNAQVQAAYLGLEMPVKREQPNEQVIEDLVSAMLARGASRELLNKVFIEGDIESLTVQEECDFSYFLFKSLSDLEEDARIRFFTFSLSEGTKL